MVPSMMKRLFCLVLSQNFALAKEAKEEWLLAQVLLHLLPHQDLRHTLRLQDLRHPHRQVLHQRLQEVLVVEREALVLHSAQLLISLILSLSYTMGARIGTTIKR